MKGNKEKLETNQHNQPMKVWYRLKYNRSTAVDCWLAKSRLTVYNLLWYTNCKIVRLHSTGWFRPDTVCNCHTMQHLWPHWNQVRAYQKLTQMHQNPPETTAEYAKSAYYGFSHLETRSESENVTKLSPNVQKFLFGWCQVSMATHAIYLTYQRFMKTKKYEKRQCILKIWLSRYQQIDVQNGLHGKDHKAIKLGHIYKYLTRHDHCSTNDGVPYIRLLPTFHDSMDWKPSHSGLQSKRRGEI